MRRGRGVLELRGKSACCWWTEGRGGVGTIRKEMKTHIREGWGLLSEVCCIYIYSNWASI